MSELKNLIRYYHFMAGVLSHQQTDPLCGICKAFANTAESMKEGLLELERVPENGLHTLPADYLHMLENSRKKIRGIITPGGAAGQKKAGNCAMPEGVCFIKVPKSVLDKL